MCGILAKTLIFGENSLGIAMYFQTVSIEKSRDRRSTVDFFLRIVYWEYRLSETQSQKLYLPPYIADIHEKRENQKILASLGLETVATSLDPTVEVTKKVTYCDPFALLDPA